MALLPGTAFATVPSIADVSVSNPYEPANTMMYEVTVTVRHHDRDADHLATVGYAPAGTDCETGRWTFADVQQFAADDVKSWILYNFQPDRPYDYKVRVGSGATAKTECGTLGKPHLPPKLAALNLTYVERRYATKYIMLDTDDCGGSGTGANGALPYIIAVDTDTENVVWYLDVTARSTLGGTDLTGWRFQSGSPSRILGVVDKRYLYEWDLDGTVVAVKDVGAGGECDDSDAQGPCIHHDAYRSDVSGKMFVIASKLTTVDATGTDWDACGTDSLFLDDGFQVWNEDLSGSARYYLMRDYGYDPAADGGPNAPTTASGDDCDSPTWRNYLDPAGVIDWTHLNSLAASSFGASEVIDLSLKSWDQIIRVDTSGKLLWKLSADPADSDWDTLRKKPGIVGSASFAGQHDVHAVAANTLMMLDNMGDSAGSRVLRISLDGESRGATIDRSWALVDAAGTPLTCELEGSAEEVPGTVGKGVLTMCNAAHAVIELNDSTGAAGEPPLYVSLPDHAGPDGFCTVGGPDDLKFIRGWYRAFPLDAMGEF